MAKKVVVDRKKPKPITREPGSTKPGGTVRGSQRAKGNKLAAAAKASGKLPEGMKNVGRAARNLVRNEGVAKNARQAAVKAAVGTPAAPVQIDKVNRPKPGVPINPPGGDVVLPPIPMSVPRMPTNPTTPPPLSPGMNNTAGLPPGARNFKPPTSLPETDSTKHGYRPPRPPAR